MASPARQPLNDLADENQKIQRQVVNIQPFVIQIHPTLSVIRLTPSPLSGTGTGTGTSTGAQQVRDMP
ncbi:MAG TPA: hypothetical protein VJV79_16575 [Polyangiaceae bacterium]|nr:hypothetical protein [Polyangiaceae bacterium]